MRTYFYRSVGVLSLILFGVTNAQAQTMCPPHLNRVTVRDVQVKGGDCEITNSTVKGNLEVADGTVSIRNSTIGGKVKSTGGAVRLLGGVDVGGNIEITQTKEETGSGFRNDNTINGNVEYRKNAGYFTAHAAMIRGNLRIQDNTGVSSLVGNTVQGNLECKGNDPPPTGFDNQVGGNKTDQCAGELRGKQGTDLRSLRRQ